MSTKNTRLPESLDEIVSHSATVLADQIQKAATWAKSEMDLQVEVTAALKDFARRAQLTELKGHHNVTIARGRPDSVYEGGVIVEYKNPGTLSPKKDAAPNRALIEQLKRRFYDMRTEEKRPWNSMMGVGTDGKFILFLRFRDDKWDDPEPLEINAYSAREFLWALYNLGQKGKPYQPEYLHGDFGSDSVIAQEGVRVLYHEILETKNPRAQVFFNQWKILFGEVCGYDVENLSDKLKKLASFYDVGPKPQPAALLFALHTYYAVLIKLLAAEIVSFFNWMPRQVAKLLSAKSASSEKLRAELENLERGGIFYTMGITNFLEGDLFSWYLAVWSKPIEEVVTRMVTRLESYNPGTFSEKPAQSRDLLKKLYQQLFPKSVRHDLGEYYTPDWLAEHVLNELGYEGDPDKRLLDPACGSGTFLVMAINRIRRWYDANRERCAYDEGDLLKRILANVIGFDLNPLAVMAARTNYLVAIKDLIRHVDRVEIPVYLCDSIMTPAEYGDLFTGGVGNVAKVPCSAMKPPHLLVPKEIAKNPRDVAKYAEVLETCVKNAYAPKEFLARCQDEGLQITATDAHLALYKELVRLDKENKNGIWARIIKNNFAPLFVGKVDYVAGNPPWINWESLPPAYRDSTLAIWDSYRLRERGGQGARLGNVKREISTLFVYVGIDYFLGQGSRLGFLITQTIFKSGASAAFRKFRIDSSTPFKPLKVADLTLLRPFEGATNRTAVALFEKGVEPTYPVPYEQWIPVRDCDFSTCSLQEAVAASDTRHLVAVPASEDDATTAWLTARPQLIGSLRKTQRTRNMAAYKAHAGSCTWLNGAFWVRVVRGGDKQSLVTNLHNVGKNKLENVTSSVETALLYPLLRGKDLKRWVAQPQAAIVLPHQVENFQKPILLPKMKSAYHHALEFFSNFKTELKKRSGYKQLFKGIDEFYAVGNLGRHSLSPWKVAFKDLSQLFQCAVIGSAAVSSENTKPVIPDHTVLYISCDTEREAYYIAGLLNSAPAVVAMHVASVAVQTQRYFPGDVERINIPIFDPNDKQHAAIAEIAKACETAALSSQSKTLKRHEGALDKLSARVWRLTAPELAAIQSELNALTQVRPAFEDVRELQPA
ncbi:MAG: N-6 DNA methylase [Acidobacteriales bacterium]|nr:N-6 DNA methylase [Terriglobales bacterium]